MTIRLENSLPLHVEGGGSSGDLTAGGLSLGGPAPDFPSITLGVESGTEAALEMFAPTTRLLLTDAVTLIPTARLDTGPGEASLNLAFDDGDPVTVYLRTVATDATLAMDWTDGTDVATSYLSGGSFESGLTLSRTIGGDLGEIVLSLQVDGTEAALLSMVPATADPRGGLFATVKDASTAFDLNSPDGNHGISMLAEDAGAQISLSGAGASLQLGGTQVVTTQQAAVADPAGGTIIDIECRAQLAAWLARARAHGLIAT